jgi:hypothetical protein
MGYPGGKSGPGVYHRLINLMPPHETYIEPFLGGGAVMRLKRPASYNIGVDLDADVISAWSTNSGKADSAGKIGGNGDATGSAGAVKLPLVDEDYPWCGTGRLLDSAKLPVSAVRGGNADSRRRRSADLAVSDRQTVHLPMADPLGNSGDRRSPRFRFLRGDALTFLASYPFQPADLIYCDPPYLMETRSSGRLYKHEMTTEQHIELLSTIGALSCRVMISGYWSELYSSSLHRWNSIHFEAMTRGGMATEWLWFNFPEPVALHDYRYLGESFRERQDLKRQRQRWIARLESMSILKKRMLLAAIAGIGADDERIH